MRLTAELIHSSLSYINPLLQRELDLRGHKIPAIENLGVAQDQDAIDLTDNALTTLPAIPHSPRLRTLLLARNRIASISPSFAAAAPQLTAVSLASNRLTTLSSLDPLLTECKYLVSLVLVENNVVRAKHYREWIAWRSEGRVRFLDFKKVTEEERETGKELFGEDDEITDLARDIIGAAGAAGAGGARGEHDIDDDRSSGRVKLTAKERKKVERMIKEAKSLGEIEKLEKELNEGRVPGGIIDDNDDDEDDDEDDDDDESD